MRMCVVGGGGGGLLGCDRCASDSAEDARFGAVAELSIGAPPPGVHAVLAVNSQAVTPAACQRHHLSTLQALRQGWQPPAVRSQKLGYCEK